MDWFKWDRENKWTGFNGTERINGLVMKELNQMVNYV